MSNCCLSMTRNKALKIGLNSAWMWENSWVLPDCSCTHLSPSPAYDWCGHYLHIVFRRCGGASFNVLEKRIEGWLSLCVCVYVWSLNWSHLPTPWAIFNLNLFAWNTTLYMNVVATAYVLTQLCEEFSPPPHLPVSLTCCLPVSPPAWSFPECYYVNVQGGNISIFLHFHFYPLYNN